MARKKIAPTAKQRSRLLIHAVIFAIVNIILWLTYDKAPLRVESGGEAYKWVSWITAAWGLALTGHWAALYRNYEDRYMNDYLEQAKG